MALVRCADCGRDISSEALSCPDCGRPNKDTNTETDNRKSVPRSITFDDLLLLLPRFEEVGIPSRLGMLGELQPLVEEGQWVERGEPLLRAVYPFYKHRKRKLWHFEDTWESKEATLSSPTHGLVIGFHEETARDEQQWGTYYSDLKVLPILLIPKNEPAPETWPLNFYIEVAQILGQNWGRLRYHQTSGSEFRLAEAVENPNLGWQPDIRRILEFNGPTLGQFSQERLSHMRTDESLTVLTNRLLDNIQQLRKADLKLREKLAHMVRTESDLD